MDGGADGGTPDGGDGGTPPQCGPVWNGSYDLPAGAVCSIDGFCYRGPITFSSDVQWIWGASATDFWMAGKRSVVHSVNGVLSGLSGLPDGPGPIHGTSTSDVWIGSLHWSGTTLTKSTTPPPGKPWFAAANDGWAVHGTMMAHWDGAAWTDVATPAVLPLTDVWGFASNNVYAIAGTILLHWDGTAWGPATPALPPGTDARVVWGAAPNDFWVGAANGLHHIVDGVLTTTTGAAQTISGSSTSNVLFQNGKGFRHWVGTGWDFNIYGFNQATANCNDYTSTAFVLPDGNAVIGLKGILMTTAYINCVAGRTINYNEALQSWGHDYSSLGDWRGGFDMTVETYGADAIPLANGSVLHRQGKEVGTGTIRTGFVSLGQWGASTADTPVAISGTSENDVWVSGTFGGTTGIASHHDAVGWSFKTLPAKPTSAIHATSMTSAWVLMGTNAAYFDGTSWVDKGMVFNGTTSQIWGNGPNEAWVIGSNSAYRWDGATWSKIPIPSGGYALRAGAGPTGAARVVTQSGAIYDWNGTALVAASPTPKVGGKSVNVIGAAFAGPDDVWLLRGEFVEPRVLHWKNGCFTSLDAALDSTFVNGGTNMFGIHAANGRVMLGSLAEKTY